MCRWRRIVSAGVAVALMIAGCSSGDDSAETSGSESPTETDSPTPTGTEPAGEEGEQSNDVSEEPVELSGPAPGVSDDAVVIGITYVDTAALIAAGLNYELGDHEAVYNALIDDINDNGGIHGRQIEPVFAAIDPTNADSADSVCLQLTEDEDVFLVTGFFLLEAVLCPVDLHETAVIGGSMTPERLAQAKAPWFSPLPDTEQPVAIVQALAEQGELDGSVAVYAAVADQEVLEDQVLPALEALGIEPVATGIMDAPTADTPAIAARVQVIAERFESDGADTVVILGASGSTWPQYQSDGSAYRPNLVFLNETAVRAFATNEATTDTSILDGALAGGSYGPDQARFDETAMQACISVLSAAGLETPAPSDFTDGDDSNQPYQAAFQACPDMVLMTALLDAAGENLNYATLAAAGVGLTVAIPGDPTERSYGPAPAADGDPVAYLFEWDSASEDLLLVG